MTVSEIINKTIEDSKVIFANKMTHEKTIKESSKYNGKTELYRENRRAYNYALKHRLLDKLFTNKQLRCDGDILYIWKVVGEKWNDKYIYKIGVTSHRLGNKRIIEVANKYGYEFELIHFEKTDKGIAFKLETEVLKFGEIPNLPINDGYTEFRALSDEELNTILKKIKE